MLNSENVGITLMAYSRPDHVKQVLNGIKLNGITKFSVFIDGADDHTIREKQSEIRAILNAVDWADISVTRRRVNHGLRISIISAVFDQLQKYEQVILLEDDCVPMPGFFDFMFKSLQTYRDNKRIRSVCGYQFPHISQYSDIVSSLCLSRFVPWGWATWRDRWNDYNPSLKELLNVVYEKKMFKSLPVDIQNYLTSEAASNGKNDIWSINWVLAHYLSNTFSIYPTRSLINNIGFDGTGVHCTETSVFNTTIKQETKCFQINVDENIMLDDITDRQLTVYMERNWGQTMERQTVDMPQTLTPCQIGSAVQAAINTVPIFDMHTHLFPSGHTEFHFSGPDALLTYHYLISEALSTTGINPQTFFLKSKKEQAGFVWDTLFRLRTPMSEAALGVLTILNKLNIRFNNSDYESIRNDMLAAFPNPEAVFDYAKISKVIMTNDPFNKNEWSLFGSECLDKSRFIASIRIDCLFFDPHHARCVMELGGFLKATEPIGSTALQHFLDAMAEQSKPAYVALSINGAALESLLDNTLFVEGVLPWLQKNGLPLALMIGVKRNVNLAFGQGGDGLGGDGLEQLERLVSSYPHITFLVTHLLEGAQYPLIVLSRKFTNLKVFGFWWFMNQPSLIKKYLNLRFDLLGTNFIPQHSDARITEQLLYKWDHFKSLLCIVLSDRYVELYKRGFAIDHEMILRDVKLLLFDNPSNFSSKNLMIRSTCNYKSV